MPRGTECSAKVEEVENVEEVEGGEFASFLRQRRVVGYPTVAEILQVVDALVSFFEYRSQLRLKLGSRPSSTCGPVVRAHRACSSTQLSCGFLRLVGFG